MIEETVTTEKSVKIPLNFFIQKPTRRLAEEAETQRLAEVAEAERQAKIDALSVLQNKLKSPAPASSPAQNDDNGMSEGESCSDSDEESDEEDNASSKQPQWTRKENLKSALLTQNLRQIPSIFGNVQNPDDGVMKGKIVYRLVAEFAWSRFAFL